MVLSLDSTFPGYKLVNLVKDIQAVVGWNLYPVDWYILQGISQYSGHVSFPGSYKAIRKNKGVSEHIAEKGSGAYTETGHTHAQEVLQSVADEDAFHDLLQRTPGDGLKIHLLASLRSIAPGNQEEGL